jgi:cell division septal protein FtsQ
VLESRVYEATLGNIIGISPEQIRLNDISDLMESHPYVKAARVSHQYPGTIQIEILERQPIALLKMDPMVMLDAEGVVLPTLNNFGDFNLPVLTNFNPEPELYPAGEKALSVKVRECIDWLSRIQVEYESLYDNLSEMKMTSTNEMELILADHPTRIYLGQDQLWARIEILKQFEEELGSKKISDFSYLDMRYENQIIAKGRRS